MRKRDLIFSKDDTIAAVSTPAGEGGIGIVRLSGKDALSIADKIFVSKDKTRPSDFKTYTTHYGHIVKNEKSKIKDKKPEREVIDEVILTVMKAPKSYTKEDVVEINCHSGIVCLRKILDLVLDLGARPAQPGEFTKRSFLNGRIDLAQAEAVLDIIKSKTESSMKVSLGQLEGALSGTVNSMKERLAGVLADLESRIDFPEEDVEHESTLEICRELVEVEREVKRLIDEAWKGIILKEGVMCVIAGKPNVGKSSLMNLFLKRQRVIVAPLPGTTRDAIEEEVNLGGIPIRLVDTAGIQDAKNIVERYGISKARSYIDRADIILFLLDLSRPWSKADGDILKAIRGKDFIPVANKSDLKKRLDLNRIKVIKGADDIIELSLLKKKNIERLEEAILRKIWRGEILHPEAAFVTNLRHKNDLECTLRELRKAIRALKKRGSPLPETVASDVKEAMFYLGSITGDATDPDVLDTIFSKFCIGK